MESQEGLSLKGPNPLTPMSRDSSQLDQAAQDHVQPGLEHLQGQGIHRMGHSEVLSFCQDIFDLTLTSVSLCVYIYTDMLR